VPVCSRADCAFAGVNQPAEAFYRLRGGRHTHCKACHRKVSAAHYYAKDGRPSAYKPKGPRRATQNDPPLGVPARPADDFEIDLFAGEAARTAEDVVSDVIAQVSGGTRDHETNHGHESTPESNASVRRLLILADFHVPLHDRLLWSALLKFVPDFRPHEVHLLGDFLDMLSVNPHGTPADFARFVDEVAAGKSAIRELQAVAPSADYWWHEGNHEAWLSSFLARHAPSLVGSTDLPKAIDMPGLGVRWVPERLQPTWRGLLGLAHGHTELRTTIPPIYHTRKWAERRGRPGHVLVYGHVHHEQSFAIPHGDGRIRAMSIPCGRVIPPHPSTGWTRGDATAASWEQGFAVAFLSEHRVDVYPVRFRAGGVQWNGKLYVGDGG